MINLINIRRFIEYVFFIVLVGVLLLVSLVSAFGVTSDYSNENRANVGPGETKIIDLLRIINSGSDTIKLEVVLKDGAGVASYDGEKEITVVGSDSKNIPI